MLKIKYSVLVITTVLTGLMTSTFADDGGLRFMEKNQAQANEHKAKAKTSSSTTKETLQAREQKK